MGNGKRRRVCECYWAHVAAEIHFDGIVGKPLNCHSRANSRDTGMWEVSDQTSVRMVSNLK